MTSDPLSEKRSAVPSDSLKGRRRRTAIAYAGAAMVGALAAFLHAPLPWVAIAVAGYVFLMLPWIFIGKSVITLWKKWPYG